MIPGWVDRVSKDVNPKGSEIEMTDDSVVQYDEFSIAFLRGMLQTVEDIKPAFCGFEIPRRVSIRECPLFLNEQSEDEKKYHELERLWDSLWTGLMVEESKTQTCFVEQSRHESILRKLIRSFHRARMRSPPNPSLLSVESSSMELEDMLMPAYPENYRDPVAIY